MAFKAVLDASVLFPFTLRDALLRSAEIVQDDAGDEILTLYAPLWSELILDEMARNIVEAAHATEEQMAHLVSEMDNAFPEAMVPLAEIKALEPSMTNHEKGQTRSRRSRRRERRGRRDVQPEALRGGGVCGGWGRVDPPGPLLVRSA